MKILVFGSLNIDYTYDVEHIVERGETISSGCLNVYTGGKGLNQAIALSKAGGNVYQAGCIGNDGGDLVKVLEEAGVNTELVRVAGNVRSGHAIIQRNNEGDNCIILYSGANRAITCDDADRVLQNFHEGDFIVLQNEISELPYIVDKAYERGLVIVLNPSPMDDVIKQIDLSKVSYLILNEIEAAQIVEVSETEDPKKMLSSLKNRYQNLKIVLTLGKDGSVYTDPEQTLTQGIYKVKTVDTTAAGDTFLGYFISSVSEGKSVEESMNLAAKASAIAVGRPGAAPSIPLLEEVQKTVL